MTRRPAVASFLLLLSLPTFSALVVPQSPQEQTKLAIRSLRQAIQDLNDDDSNNNKRMPKRLFVDYLIPLPPETQAEDIDPWPGGLAQMYPYAETIVTEILAGIVDEPAAGSKCSSQVISQSDCCGFFVQESKTAPQQDIGAILFPGVDQLDKIAEIDQMVGDQRTLLLFNRQFQRPADFGFADKGRAQSIIFDRFQWGFAFQELACRGEDVKLTFDYPNWHSCVICSEDEEMGNRQIDLLSPSKERPAYEALEKEINRVLPEPLWMRKMGEVERKGFKFQRGGNK